MVVLLILLCPFCVRQRQGSIPIPTALDDDRTCRKRRPKQEALLPRFSKEERERRCYPDAETVEATCKLAPEPSRQPLSHLPEQIPRARLGSEQVADSPDCKTAEYEPVELHDVFGFSEACSSLG